MEGYFPMAEGRHGEIYWHSPDPRAIFPFAGLYPSRKVIKSFNKYNFKFTIDTHFSEVIEHCANRNSTWINDDIIHTYNDLFSNGYAHSVEVHSDNILVGGLYGVSINGAFFGESMFNTVPNASKAAFYYLLEHLRNQGYLLLDSQYLNPFTEQLGAIEISKNLYMFLLRKALDINCRFI